jgi:TetR/AcrR family transcriptional regulator, transcriptional repressor for nem operon
MKVSREQVAENRRKILDAAARLFRERGFDAVTVAEVMKSAGLTHGAFYGHFKSKDDLIAQTLLYALDATQAVATQAVGEGDLARYARWYLTPGLRDNRAEGCTVAGLGAETIRQSPEARAAMTAGLRKQIERLSKGVPSADAREARRAAIGSWAAMVGGMILARLVEEDPELSDEVLEQTRTWIEQQSASGGRGR